MDSRLKSIIGIDIGSVSLAVAQLSHSGELVNKALVFHKGNLRKAISDLEEGFDLRSTTAIASAGKRGIDSKKAIIIDPQVAVIDASRHLYPDARSILQVGAEKFFLVRFDNTGKYSSTSFNSSCAAGTGSFLDQQAFRLNLSGSAELAATAMKNQGPMPTIASRCAVFAKTDLIHAQQKGYSLEAICDSLCRGLAENIFDSLFNKEGPVFPMLFLGGVSINQAVVKHLESLLRGRLTIPDNSILFGAIGAAQYALRNNKHDFKSHNINSFSDILDVDLKERQFFHQPLKQTKSRFPEFKNSEPLIFKPETSGHIVTVQYDVYDKPQRGKSCDVILGIDIGSTSTKAILLKNGQNPIAGFYTYTAGKPLTAVKAIFENINFLEKDLQTAFNIKGCGTTGSGRKFAGKVIGADSIIDEITAHARAAYHLNPATDTIIEIGGQDAKFTSLDNGTVTFSQMNTVCAAGTGSFLEEQAEKLGCPLSDYQEKAMMVNAPMASDRCTVFMERDINQLLNAGYRVEELLATSLHSVAENYLQKVASEAKIGKEITFQGATAKNKALVAAFEQRLNKKIFVSKFCHLTGAMGAAILTFEDKKEKSTFRGLNLYTEKIPLEYEVCELCSNRCHISVARVKGEKIAYGFMCGRDYDTQKYVNLNTSGFNLINERKKIQKVKVPSQPSRNFTIGLPASLHMHEDIPFWKAFFSYLSIKVISTEDYGNSLKEGKRYAGAEFCAPIDSMYGHIAHLAEKADYIFLPVVLESKLKSKLLIDRNYCYYSQFSPAIAHTLQALEIEKKLLSPRINFFKGKLSVIKSIQKALRGKTGEMIPMGELESAYEKASEFEKETQLKLYSMFNRYHDTDNNISVMLLGRPYVILSKSLNKGIPDIISGMGVKTFFQDMQPYNGQPPEDIGKLLRKVPWHFASVILETAKRVALSKNLYPVLITAFKCSPDAFIIEYFKKIFNLHGKPYLILQIDEHDSNIGYETRIESALRAFRNHASKNQENKIPEPFQLLPPVETEIRNRTLLFPNWDSIVSPLLVANLRRSGVDARLLESSELSIKKSMAHNTGQCLPLNIITQEYMEYIDRYKLDPSGTLLWMLESRLSCNLRMYPFYIKTILENQGNGYEKASVYSGDLAHREISLKTTYHGYFAYMAGGLLKKMICKIRPYEMIKGETDHTAMQSMDKLVKAFSGELPLEETISDITKEFSKIKTGKLNKPRVAIFGDLYVRDNDIMNQGLIRDIEEAGGEVLTTPYTEYVKITLDNYIRRALDRGDYLGPATARLMMTATTTFEEKYFKYFKKILGPHPLVDSKKLESRLSKFNIDKYHSGESYDNILKIFYIMDNYPDVRLFIQTSPAYCCPSLITEAMTHEITRITGVPVVTINYDGTSEPKNDVIIPYLKYAVESD